MFEPIRFQFKKAQQFAVENKALVACAVTAIVASKITYDFTCKEWTEKVADFYIKAENDMGVLSLQNRVLLDFVNSKELDDEFLDFINMLK